jgi:hypothetical protein
VSNVSIAQARRAKERLKALLGSDENVVGVGLTKGTGGYVVKLNLRAAPGMPNLPAVIDGVPVIHEVVGRIKKL